MLLDKNQQEYVKKFYTDHQQKLKKIDVIKNNTSEQKINIEIFVINLKKRPERLKKISDQLAKNGIHNFNIIDATDGKAIPESKLLDLLDNNFATNAFGKNRLAESEIGCSDSHNRIYREVIKKNLSHALVLEDDCVLSDDFSEFWNCLKNEKSINADVLLLGYWSPEIKTESLGYSVGGKDMSKFLNLNLDSSPAWGTYGYLISYWGCMKMLLCNSKIRFAADMPWIYFKENFDLFALTEKICVGVDEGLGTDILVRGNKHYWIDALFASHN